MSAAPLSLEELLRRAHRDELLPLAEALRVNAQGFGRDALAALLAKSLRRAGGNTLMNLLRRRGEGPPWEAALADLGARLGLPPQPDAEAAELALVAAQAARAWPALDEQQRAATWAALGGQGAAPREAEAALQAAARIEEKPFSWRLLAAFGAASALRAVALALLPVSGPLGCLAVLALLGRPQPGLLLPATLEVARLRAITRHRATVGLVGSPSSGKDAAIRAIFGIDTGNIHPVAGSTRQVAILSVPGATALYVVNTPGLGDVVAAVTAEARQVLDHIDVYVYVLNAQGGVAAREAADWAAVAATGRPALVVCNKVDTLRPQDRDRYLADARRKLAVGEADFLAVAFDPLPQLAPEPLGVAETRAWLRAALVGLGKDPASLGVLG